ncbi:MAG: hypothetical protein R3F14_10520 [Polyangiaceae bacterium]
MSAASIARSSPSTRHIARVRRPPEGALILSGGPASVYDEGAPSIGPRLFDLGIPTLGICYGLQLIAGSSEAASSFRERPRVRPCHCPD